MTLGVSPLLVYSPKLLYLLFCLSLALALKCPLSSCDPEECVVLEMKGLEMLLTD